MEATVIAYTTINPDAIEEETGFVTEGVSGQDLAEFAGRACYQAFGRKNPKTATNAGYIANILNHGHFSVLEHGTVSMYFTGVSRSLTHELVRHRHFNFSQLSQRYVDESHSTIIIPPEIEADCELSRDFLNAASQAQAAYRRYVEKVEQRLKDRGETGFALRKHSRQAARGILPNATETRIVVTGNHRAWRHFIDMRATEAADLEIRNLAIVVLDKLRSVDPNIYADYVVTELPDGSKVAKSPYREVS